MTRTQTTRRTVKIAAPLVVAAAATFFVTFYGEHYPVAEWLFWRYAIYWVSCAVFSAACLSTGYAVLVRLRVSALPFLESLCLSFTVGVTCFYLAMNVLGHAHALRWPAFFLLPVAMIAAGARPLFRTMRRYVRHVRHRRAHHPRALDYLVMVSWLFGLLVIGMIYFQILSPENAQFDALWKHLGLAEQYAHVGHIPRYGEGWTVATNPHLASMIYTWAFLLPGMRLFDHVALAAHLELTTMVWGVAAIVPLTRRLLPGHRASAAWAARFLFPGVLLYDSSLACGADHIASAFAAPIFLALLRALPRLEPQRCALLVLLMAGAAMTKLSSAILLVPAPTLAVGAVVLARALRRRPRRVIQWQGPLTALVVGLLATSPFWLRNLVWYGDPLYPSLYEYLSPRPWTADAADMFKYGYGEFQFDRPTRDLAGVVETLEALVTFSFIPNDYARYHGKVPTFGSLFTLLILCLPLFRRTRRIWGLVAATHLALFLWYWVHHQDRYLQVIVPWMAAVVAAILILLWRAGIAARLTASVLIVAQVVIGGDVYFIQSHAMIGTPLKKSMELLESGYKRRYEQRFEVFGGWVAVSKALPEDAHALVHETHPHLGLSRRTTNDWCGWQYGLSYGELSTPRNVYDRLRTLGVTHAVWRHQVSKGWDTVAGDLVFFDFAFRHMEEAKKVGSMRVARMPDEPPPDDAPGDVAVFGCDDMYASGLYALNDLTVPVFGPKRHAFPEPKVRLEDSTSAALLSKAAFVVADTLCDGKHLKGTPQGFALAAKRKLVNSDRRRGKKLPWSLYVRERSAPER